jgi:precorrin-6B methylase 2
MTAYYSTFVSGLGALVKRALAAQLSDAKIDLLLDGLVAYQSDQPLQKIKSLRFCNNTHLLLQRFPLSKRELGGRPIESLMAAVLQNPQRIPGAPRWALHGVASFRIVASLENQTEAVDPELLEKMEKFFSYRLRLRTNRSKPDVEVWFLARREGHGFLSLRLTRPPNYAKILQKGELRPELAHLLCYLSEPKKDDVFLDPFAGSGAIPLERARAFPFQQVLAGEQDAEVFKKLQKRVSAARLKITLGKWDALELSSIASHSISKIVSDPPWGMYAQQKIDWGEFYAGMLREFERVLKEGGRLVLLIGQKELFEGVLQQFPRLPAVERYDILVSGKKAAIYKIMNMG